MYGNIPTWAIHASRAIMQAVRVKDLATFEHCVRVSRGSRLLAEASGMNAYEAKVIEFAGLFHDIGKIGTPDDILFKPAKLTPEEYEIMKRHPEESVRIIEPLNHLEFFRNLIPGVRHHHERIDGCGYPFGLAGDKIPLSARMILIADTFDAMTMTRAYRKGLSPEAAHKELRDCAGTQFDQQLVKVFVEAQPRWQAQEVQVAEEMNDALLRTAG